MSLGCVARYVRGHALLGLLSVLLHSPQMVCFQSYCIHPKWFGSVLCWCMRYLRFRRRRVRCIRLPRVGACMQVYLCVWVLAPLRVASRWRVLGASVAPVLIQTCTTRVRPCACTCTCRTVCRWSWRTQACANAALVVGRLLRKRRGTGPAVSRLPTCTHAAYLRGGATTGRHMLMLLSQACA